MTWKVGEIEWNDSGDIHTIPIHFSRTGEGHINKIEVHGTQLNDLAIAQLLVRVLNEKAEDGVPSSF